jgi:hypothetical protein
LNGRGQEGDELTLTNAFEAQQKVVDEVRVKTDDIISEEDTVTHCGA